MGSAQSSFEPDRGGEVQPESTSSDSQPPTTTGVIPVDSTPSGSGAAHQTNGVSANNDDGTGNGASSLSFLSATTSATARFFFGDYAGGGGEGGVQGGLFNATFEMDNEDDSAGTPPRSARAETTRHRRAQQLLLTQVQEFRELFDDDEEEEEELRALREEGRVRNFPLRRMPKPTTSPIKLLENPFHIKMQTVEVKPMVTLLTSQGSFKTRDESLPRDGSRADRSGGDAGGGATSTQLTFSVDASKADHGMRDYFFVLECFDKGNRKTAARLLRLERLFSVSVQFASTTSSCRLSYFPVSNTQNAAEEFRDAFARIGSAHLQANSSSKTASCSFVGDVVRFPTTFSGCSVVADAIPDAEGGGGQHASFRERSHEEPVEVTTIDLEVTTIEVVAVGARVVRNEEVGTTVSKATVDESHFSTALPEEIETTAEERTSCCRDTTWQSGGGEGSTLISASSSSTIAFAPAASSCATSSVTTETIPNIKRIEQKIFVCGHEYGISDLYGAPRLQDDIAVLDRVVTITSTTQEQEASLSASAAREKNCNQEMQGDPDNNGTQLVENVDHHLEVQLLQGSSSSSTSTSSACLSNPIMVLQQDDQSANVVGQEQQDERSGREDTKVVLVGTKPQDDGEKEKDREEPSSSISVTMHQTSSSANGSNESKSFIPIRPAADSEEDERCICCYENVRSVVVLPCRHMCLCPECATKLGSQRQFRSYRCPMCRHKVAAFWTLEYQKVLAQELS
ncbi:unnamed protein product [Amoebophrya sp. A25]|nr:unnamed protein product [Amoebophrya sp. A25]|eukprot:GSA25T00016777001.1